ncbi:MAG: glycosyltransferase family 4 protein [Aromatoleum sp.]|nr:glycosyltransferase family 4 protein [Aromatoleum sp.]
MRASAASQHGVGLPAWSIVLPWDPSRPGGVDLVALNLYREMRSRGVYEPRMLIASWEHPAPLDSVDDGRPTTRIRLRSPVGGRSALVHALTWLLALPAELPRLARHLRAHRVAVVNAHFPGLSALQFVLVKRFLYRDLRVVLSFHGLDIGGAARTRGLERWLWRRLLRSADALVACSHDLAGQIRAFDPGVTARTVTIHNGLDTDGFLAEAAPDAVLDPRLEGRRYILSVAAYEPKKGLDVLIRAFASLVPRVEPDVLLVLVGVDRGIRAELLALAANLGVADRVVSFTDVAQARLHPFYRAATAFCLPSRREPFGLVLLEAGAYSLPVVASRVGGVPEIIAHGETGRLVPPEDPEALAAELQDLLSHPAERARLGAALHSRVRARFTWAAAYERYVALRALEP